MLAFILANVLPLPACSHVDGARALEFVDATRVSIVQVVP